ncbi:MAG: MFS transporter [Aeromicrobium sp.]
MVARRQLWYIALVQVLAMSMWFSASAVSGSLSREWGLTSTGESLLTTSVQLGFVTGAVASAVLNLADRVSPHVVMASAAVTGAVLNAGVAVFSDGLGSALVLRFLTGVALAGVYPVGMKVMTTWFARGRGLALGIMVGALTLGSASPHLIRSVESLSWRPVLATASVLAMLGGLIAVGLVRTGPHHTPSPPFDPRYVLRMFGDRTQRLINFGYLGHMWELYALWAWLPTFVAASLAARQADASPSAIAWLTFAAIGVAGALGCVLAGRSAGRVGSLRVARVALGTSGLCCLVSPLFFGAHPVLLGVLLMVWGASVIADSAQFSSALSEAADDGYIGTALTAQTALGFTLTIVTIQLLPLVADLTGWRLALIFLGVGPALGTWSTSRLLRPSGR